MAGRVKVRQKFQQTPATTFQGDLESVYMAPVMRTVQRQRAGTYDTTAVTPTKFVFPAQLADQVVNYRWYDHNYGSAPFVNVDHPDLTADAEQHLNTLINNIGAINRFREDKDDNSDLDGVVSASAQINLFHPNVMPGSVVIALAHTTDSQTPEATTGGGHHLWIPAAQFPSGGGDTADGVIDGTMVVKSASGDVTYSEGSDWTLEYVWGGDNPYSTGDDAGAGETYWLLRFPVGSQISASTDIKLTFEGKLPFTYKVGGDVEPDYSSGSLSLSLGGTITDPIVYYGFWPQVGVAAFIQERLTGNLTQLDFQDFTIKADAGVNKVWLRPGLQGAIFSGQGLTLNSTNLLGDDECGTKTNTEGFTGFDVGGPCGSIPACDTLRFCVFEACSQTNGPDTDNSFDVVVTDVGTEGDGSVAIAQIVTAINSKSDLNDRLYAYAGPNGELCLELSEPSSDGYGQGGSPVDMRGADNWIVLKTNSRDLAPMLGLDNGIILCGRTTYNVEEAAGSPQFQVRQDNLGNILGSVIVDGNENRYRVNRIVDDNELVVEQVDSNCVPFCGTCPTEIVNAGTTLQTEPTLPFTRAWELHYCDYSSDVLVTYNAFRGDLGDSIIEIENGGDDLLTKLSEDGTQDNFSYGPDNPGAYGLSKYVFTNGTRIQLFLPVVGYDEVAYQAAIEALELSSRPHLLVPMTYDEDAIAALSAHVQDMADPDETYEPMTRMLFTSSLVKDGEAVRDSVNDGATVRFNANPASFARTSDEIDAIELPNTTGRAKTFVLTDGNNTTTDFVDDGVKVGDIVRIHNGINAGDWVVKSIQTDNGGVDAHALTCGAIDSDQYFIAVDTDHADLTTLQSAGDIASMAVQDNLVSYTIYRRYSKSEHLNEIKGIATGLRGAQWAYRNVKAWCPFHIDEDTPDGRTATVPGYFLNASMCGSANIAPVQQGYTNYPLNGGSDLRYTKGWFSERQLQEIEDEGIWVWTSQPGQNTYAAREQFTVSGYNAAESLASQFSLIRVADKMHRRFYNSLIGFTGIYNITAENLSIFRGVVNAAIRAAREATAPRLGGEIKNGFVVSINCDPDNPRTVLLRTRIIPNEPVDTFDITNHVRRG